MAFSLFSYELLDSPLDYLSRLPKRIISALHREYTSIYGSCVRSGIDYLVAIFVNIFVSFVHSSGEHLEHFCSGIFGEKEYIFLGKVTRVHFSHDIFCVRLEYGYGIVFVIILLYGAVLEEDYGNSPYGYGEDNHSYYDRDKRLPFFWVWKIIHNRYTYLVMRYCLLYPKSPERKMKKRFMKWVKGFTLIEIIVAMTISVMIMGGIIGFLIKLQNDILLSKQSTRVYTSLTDFIGVMNNFGKLYASGSVVVEGTGTYNVWLLVRPDKASWVLIWVVEEKKGNLSKLDPVSSKNTYGKKVIAYRKLTAWQISSLLSDTGSIYSIEFTDEWLFEELIVKDFFITPYNSGTLLEYTFDIETPFHEALKGQSRGISIPNVMSFSFTLDF